MNIESHSGIDVFAEAPRLIGESSRMKWLIVSLTLCLLSIHAFAQTSTASQEPPPAQDAPADKPSRWQWSFTLRNRTGFKLDEPHRFQMSRTIFDAKGLYKINDDWKLTLEGRAHYDPVRRLGYPNGVWPIWLDPRQVLLDGRIKKVDLKLGLQQVVWGQADGLRVLDVINPLDYREFILEDFLDSRRPLWMARADAPVGRGFLQMIWVPYFAPARLPGPDNEFGLGSSFGLGLINSAAGLPRFPVRVEATTRPGYQLKSSQAGARYSRSVGKWDLTANYFYGWEDVPTSYLQGIEFKPDAPLPTLVFRPKHDRKEVFGGTAATNFGSVVLRLEAGWNRNKSAAVTDDPLTGANRTGFEKFGQFSGVVGVDWSAKTWLWVSGQYFSQTVAAPQPRLLFPRTSHLASFYFRTNFFRDTFRPEFFVLTGLNQRQYMVRPRLTRSINDHWSVGIGADFLGGRENNLFGYFDSRDRVVIELKWLN
ncbi:MAG: DUF1302 family protein [Blastocatellia bacterium]